MITSAKCIPILRQWILSLVAAAQLVTLAMPLSEHPLLLVIAYDGFRYDYLNPVKTPFLWNLAQKGTYAEYGIRPQYFTYTTVNFASLVTGKYADSHGIVGNVFYDPQLMDTFDYFNISGNQRAHESARDPKWWTTAGVPIWQVPDLCM